MIDNIATLYKWALMGRAPLERWNVGRVSLLGDACHPTLPMLAQGAAMALEDGFVLARALAAPMSNRAWRATRMHARNAPQRSCTAPRKTHAGSRTAPWPSRLVPRNTSIANGRRSG